jgi:NAD(P)-dependent dehydrogenase (short-subunit alcohol dehydrogenase family)
MQLDLEGKHVLITGASKGIGLATAWAFASSSAPLSVCLSAVCLST